MSEKIAVARRAIESAKYEQRAGGEYHEDPPRILAQVQTEGCTWIVDESEPHGVADQLVRNTLRNE